jgi:hypothetical protein
MFSNRQITRAPARSDLPDRDVRRTTSSTRREYEIPEPMRKTCLGEPAHRLLRPLAVIELAAELLQAPRPALAKQQTDHDAIRLRLTQTNIQQLPTSNRLIRHGKAPPFRVMAPGSYNCAGANYVYEFTDRTATGARKPAKQANLARKGS